MNSATPRKYEANLHTGVVLAGSAADFRADLNPAELCGTVASPDPITMSTAVGYYPAPTVAAAPHYWSKFNYATAKNRGLFVSVLRSDCLSAKPNIVFNGTGATITLGPRVINVTDADVTVQ